MPLPVLSDKFKQWLDGTLNPAGNPMATRAGDVMLGTRLNELADLFSAATGKGASTIGVEDAAGNFAGADVEAVLAEIIADYAAVTSGNGASKIGIEDVAGRFTGPNVEAALAELGEGRTRFARGIISPAAVRTLNATPVQMVAAPGAGLYIEVVKVHWWLDHTGADFDAAAAGDTLAAKYTDDSGAEVVDNVAGDVIGGASADYHTIVSPLAEVIPVAAAAIVAHINTGEWYGAAGDSSLKYEVEYKLKSFEFGTP